MEFTYTNLSDKQIAWFQAGISGFGIQRGSYTRGYPLNAIPVAVTVSVVPEPTCPGHKDAMCTHSLVPDVANIEIRQGLDDPEDPINIAFENDPNPAETVKQFWLEAVVHELAHVCTFYLVQDDEMKNEIAQCFVMQDVTGEAIRVGEPEDWSPEDKPWEERITEAIAETLKDHYFAGRVYDNRTKWRVMKNKWEIFMRNLLPPYGADELVHSLFTIPASMSVAWTPLVHESLRLPDAPDDQVGNLGFSPRFIMQKSWDVLSIDTASDIDGSTEAWSASNPTTGEPYDPRESFGPPRAEFLLNLPPWILELARLQSGGGGDLHNSTVTQFFQFVVYIEWFSGTAFPELILGEHDIGLDIPKILAIDPVSGNPYSADQLNHSIPGPTGVYMEEICREHLLANNGEVTPNRVALAIMGGPNITFSRSEPTEWGSYGNLPVLLGAPVWDDYLEQWVDAGGEGGLQFPDDRDQVFAFGGTSNSMIEYNEGDEYVRFYGQAWPNIPATQPGPPELPPYTYPGNPWVGASIVTATVEIAPFASIVTGGGSDDEFALGFIESYLPESFRRPNGWPVDDFMSAGYGVGAWEMRLIEGVPPPIPEREKSGIVAGPGTPGVIRLGW